MHHMNCNVQYDLDGYMYLLETSWRDYGRSTQGVLEGSHGHQVISFVRLLSAPQKLECCFELHVSSLHRK